MNKKKVLLCLMGMFITLLLFAETPVQELTQVLEDEQWYIWYFNDILRSKNRDTIYFYNKELKENPKIWRDEYDDFKYWYEHLLYSQHQQWQTMIYFGNKNSLTLPWAHYYKIMDIKINNSLYIINIHVSDERLKEQKDLDRNIGINWDLINNRTEFTFLFLFDGDYLDIFIDDFDTYFTTFCHFYGSAWEQLESLIYTNTCDLTNVTFPRRADKNHTVGISCIVAENLRLRKEESTSSATLQTMQTGTTVKILQLGKKQTIDGITANWVQVELADGTRGWCFGGYLVEK